MNSTIVSFIDAEVKSGVYLIIIYHYLGVTHLDLFILLVSFLPSGVVLSSSFGHKLRLCNACSKSCVDFMTLSGRSRLVLVICVTSRSVSVFHLAEVDLCQTRLDPLQLLYLLWVWCCLKLGLGLLCLRVLYW